MKRNGFFNSKMKRQNGLTLIEVLVASLLLFVSLGVVSIIFQQNIFTQSQAVKYFDALEHFPSIQAQIRFELEQGHMQGQLKLGEQEYQWQASVIQQGMELIGVSPETGQQEGTTGILQLINISVTAPNNLEFEMKHTRWQNNEG